MSEPRISAFARLANGNAKPTRVIAGQTARVSRTMHGIFYDPTHDEIVVPVALGGAVLTLPGGADGGAPPLRVLQGPATGLVQPDTLYVDVAHDEMIVDSGDDSVLVFPRTATGQHRADPEAGRSENTDPEHLRHDASTASTTSSSWPIGSIWAAANPRTAS